ncbi:hypothetical protein GEMRC1_012298 [Eukaryota sp. GEM-RC1]
MTISNECLIAQGAEAKITSCIFHGKPCIVKHRFVKTYRHPELDSNLRERRTSSEVKCIVRAREKGISVPALYLIDIPSSKIFMQHIQGAPLRVLVLSIQRNILSDTSHFLETSFTEFGLMVAKLHHAGIVHGDLTTSNVLVEHGSECHLPSSVKLFLIDFGLAQGSQSVEDKAVDIGVLEKAITSVHNDSATLMEFFISGYQQGEKGMVKEVLKRYENVKKRGRKRSSA